MDEARCSDAHHTLTLEFGISERSGLHGAPKHMATATPQGPVDQARPEGNKAAGDNGSTRPTPGHFHGDSFLLRGCRSWLDAKIDQKQHGDKS